jgi:hypothetical protein
MRRGVARIIFLCLGLTLDVWAGPTLLTEDPGTPGPRAWEINLGLTGEHRPGEKAFAGPILDLNYGLGPAMQIKYMVAWLWLRPAGSAREDGLGNSLAGLKWRFWEDKVAGRAASVFPQFEFRTPGSDAARGGLVPDENTLLLPVQWQLRAAGCDLLLEAGRALPSKSAAGWYGGVALLRVLPGGTELAAELNWQADHGLHRTELVANLAVMVPLTERAGLLVTVGRELHNHNAPRANLLGYVGCQLSL